MLHKLQLAYLNCVSTLNGTTHDHAKENRQLRRQSSNESDDSEKKRLKTVCQLNLVNLPYTVESCVMAVCLLHLFTATFWLQGASITWVVQKVYSDTLNKKIHISYFVTFQHNLLQLKCTWSCISPKLGFQCRRIVCLALPGSHLRYR